MAAAATMKIKSILRHVVACAEKLKCKSNEEQCDGKEQGRLFFGWAGCEGFGAKKLAGLDNTVSLLLH
jgi:hypothetical protein